MSPVFDCTTDQGRAEGVAAAVEAVRAGEVVVLPTDTVYGVGADAFSAEAVAAVLAAKGRGREMPPPVLVPSPRTVDGLATAVPAWARDLMRGAVARPADPGLPRAVLADVGPRRHQRHRRAADAARTTSPWRCWARSVRWRSPAPTSPASPPPPPCCEAAAQLGGAVSVYLDGGPSRGGAASTIVDCTTETP